VRLTFRRGESPGLDAADLAAIEYDEYLAEGGHPRLKLRELDSDKFSTAIADIVRARGELGIWLAPPRKLFAAGISREVKGWPRTSAGFAERYRRTGWEALFQRSAFDAPIFYVDDRDEVTR
jgi:hypothetical protein